MWETFNITQESCTYKPQTIFLRHEKRPIYDKSNYCIGYEYQALCLTANPNSTDCLICEKYLQQCRYVD